MKKREANWYSIGYNDAFKLYSRGRSWVGDMGKLKEDPDDDYTAGFNDGKISGMYFFKKYRMGV